MRISTSMLYVSASAQIDNLQAQVAQTQQEIATGSSILTPADNPVAAAQALVVTQTQADNTQYMANGQSATNSLSQETTTLQSVTTLIQNAQSAIVDAGNGSYTLQQRQDIASGLQQSFTQLVGLANAQDANGNYLFSGYQSASPPFSQTGAGVVYNGDQGQVSVQVGPTQQMAIGDSGSSVFENNVTGNGTFTTAAGAPLALPPVPPPLPNVGSGVISSGSVTNAAALTGDSYSVVFSGSGPLGNGGVLPNLGSGAISPTTVVNQALVNGDTYTLAFNAGGTYNVTDATSGATVSSNNPYVAGQTITVGGVQVTMSGSPANGDQFTVPSQATYTVTDTSVPNSASAAPPVGPQAYVPGQAIAFDGLQFNVTGSPSNGDTFTVNPSPKQSVFTTLSNLINLLNTPTSGVAGETNLTNGLNTASNNLSSALNNVLTVQSSIGARLNELTSLNTQGSNLNVQYASTLSGLESVNDAQAISQLSEQQLTLTAAQQSFVKIANLSLFNYIT